MRKSVKIGISISYIALGVVLSQFFFPVLGSKAYPFQHMINILSGVTLGPIYAVFIAVAIGVIRNLLGIGTLYAFPGGVPGALVVGSTYIIMKRLFGPYKAWKIAALTEPIGTVGLGATFSFFIFAGLIGDERILALASDELLQGFIIFSSGWLLSSLVGVAFAYAVLIFIEKSGYYKILLGDE